MIRGAPLRKSGRGKTREPLDPVPCKILEDCGLKDEATDLRTRPARAQGHGGGLIHIEACLTVLMLFFAMRS